MRMVKFDKNIDKYADIRFGDILEYVQSTKEVIGQLEHASALQSIMKICEKIHVSEMQQCTCNVNIKNDSIHTTRYFGYVAATEHYSSSAAAFLQYAQQKGLRIQEVFQDLGKVFIHWRKRGLVSFLTEFLQPGDTLLVLSCFSLASTKKQIFDILSFAQSQRINIHFVNYDVVFKGKDVQNTADLISIMRKVARESDLLKCY